MYQTSIVMTTINDPVLLEDYYKNILKYGHMEKVEFIVIPDLKKPTEAYERILSLRKKGMHIRYPSIEEQEHFLKRLDFPKQMIPYNSDNRRNIGYLMALESENEFIISIDDDNYCLPQSDFILEHSIVNKEYNNCKVTSSENGWYNVCDLLEFDTNYSIYPRGYPYFAKHVHNKYFTKVTDNVDIHINAGLWIEDPDVDALTWLVAPSKVKTLKKERTILDQNTWSPINTQNTSLRREAIVSYYFLKMGYPFHGLKIDRYGDIFSGYFVQKCAKTLGGCISFGIPLAQHKRSPHNYIYDAVNELGCIIVLEDILKWLKDVKLQGNNYFDVYLSLCDHLQDDIEKFTGTYWDDTLKAYFHQMTYYMKTWAKVCKKFF